MKRKIHHLLAACLLSVFALSMAALQANVTEPDNLPGLGLQPDEVFFTGKPYSEAAGGYLFKYRTYDPEINRWTTPDPSGFPDGANNLIYSATPLSQFDPTGKALYDYTTVAYESGMQAMGSYNGSHFAGTCEWLTYKAENDRCFVSTVNVLADATSTSGCIGIQGYTDSKAFEYWMANNSGIKIMVHVSGGVIFPRIRRG